MDLILTVKAILDIQISTMEIFSVNNHQKPTNNPPARSQTVNPTAALAASATRSPGKCISAGGRVCADKGDRENEARAVRSP